MGYSDARLGYNWAGDYSRGSRQGEDRQQLKKRARDKFIHQRGRDLEEQSSVWSHWVRFIHMGHMKMKGGDSTE